MFAAVLRLRGKGQRMCPLLAVGVERQAFAGFKRGEEEIQMLTFAVFVVLVEELREILLFLFH